MNSIKMKILFAIIIVPMLTVAVLRQYLQHLWTRKNGGESSGFTNFNIFDTLNYLRTVFLAKHSSHCKKWHCISLLMWPSHHQFQMIFLSQSRLFPCIIAFTMILYQLTLKLAWYINSYITFQIGTCPRPPRFDNHDEAWLCLGLAAFITLSWDNIAIMRALAMQWCTYRGSHHSPYSYVYTYSPIPLY